MRCTVGHSTSRQAGLSDVSNGALTLGSRRRTAVTARHTRCERLDTFCDEQTATHHVQTKL